MKVNAKRLMRVHEVGVLGWCSQRAAVETAVELQRAQRSVDAADASWRLGKLRVQASLCKHHQGGHRDWGLRVCTKIKMLPQLGQRGASDGCLTIGSRVVLVGVAVEASNALALWSR